MKIIPFPTTWTIIHPFNPICIHKGVARISSPPSIKWVTDCSASLILLVICLRRVLFDPLIVSVVNLAGIYKQGMLVCFGQLSPDRLDQI